MAVFFDTATKIAAHNAVVTAWSTGGLCKAVVRNAANTVLAEIPLLNPCGVVDTDGKLTLSLDGRDESAAHGGTANNLAILDYQSVVRCSMPCAAGTTPLTGYCVMPTLTVTEDAPFEVTYITFGPDTA